MNKISLLLLILLVHPLLKAQNVNENDPDMKPDWWGHIPGFLNQQAKITLNTVNEALTTNPPELKESLIRKMSLLQIDNVMHNEKAPEYPSVQEFFRNRIETAVGEIRNARVKKGVLIWKLYNHSFIVKTPSVTIGFDIQRGLRNQEGFSLDKKLTSKLIDVTDILFVSHLHGDHADEWVAATFLEQNKPVVSPPGIFADSPVYPKILHPERKAEEIQEIYLPEKGLSLKAIIYPGHQGESVLNNVYLVFTPEGFSISHTGDQSNRKDFEWIDRIGSYHRVDVLMPNCWTTDPKRVREGFRPNLIIPGHENEMGHTVDHREPYWLNQNRLAAGSSFPVVQMAWGEKFHYLPGKYKRH